MIEHNQIEYRVSYYSPTAKSTRKIYFSKLIDAVDYYKEKAEIFASVKNFKITLEKVVTTVEAIKCDVEEMVDHEE